MNYIRIINQENKIKNNKVKNIMLNLLIISNYICSFFSVTSNSFQPSLICLTVWVKDTLNIFSVTSYFGYHHVYYLQGNQKSKIQTLLDNLGKENVFQYTGYSFIIGLSFSLLFLIFSKMYNKIILFRVLSWILLLVSICTYFIGFYNTMHKHTDNYNLFNWNISLGLGMISSCLNLFLIPISF